MKCGKCGAEFASGKFCPECGCRVDVCPACGADRSAGSKFCNECGYSYLSPKQDVASAQGSESKSMRRRVRSDSRLRRRLPLPSRRAGLSTAARNCLRSKRL